MLNETEININEKNFESTTVVPIISKSNATTSNPGTNKVTRYKIIAFINHPTKPKVIIFIGSSRIFKNGLKKAFNKARTTAAVNSTLKSLPYVKPGRIADTNIIAIVFRIIFFTRDFIVVEYHRQYTDQQILKSLPLVNHYYD